MDPLSPAMDHNIPTEFSADLQGETSQETLASVRAVVTQLEEEYRNKGVRLSGRIIHVTHYLPLVVTLNPSPTPTNGAPISPPKTPQADIVALEAEKAHKQGTLLFRGHYAHRRSCDSPDLFPVVEKTEQELPEGQSTPSPSATPVADSTSSSSKWHISPRRGHTAMISGIRSLCNTHEQVLLAWTGDIETGSVDALSTGKKSALGAGTRQSIDSSSLSDEDKADLEKDIGAWQSPHDQERGDCKKLSYVPVFLDDKTAHGHYEGYCKTSTSFPPQ